MDERIDISQLTRRKYIKRAAKQILFSDWLGQILAFFIVGAVFTGIIHFGANGMLLVEQFFENEVVSGLLFLPYCFLAAAVIVPMFYGLVEYEINAAEKGKGELKDIFQVFSSVSCMTRAYKLFAYLVFKTFLCFLPAVFAYVLLFAQGEDTFSLNSFVWHNINYANLFIETLFVICLFFGAVLSCKYFMGVFICVIKPELKIKDAFFAAKMCCHTNKFGMAKLMFSFLPLLWVSLYTAGLLFVLYSFPYILITFVLQSKCFYETEISTKNVQNLLYTQENEN